MLKEELRTTYLQRRNHLTSEALDRASINIANQLLGLPIWSFDYYHLFLSIENKKEINTQYLLSVLQGKDKQVVLPKLTSKNTFTNYLLTDGTRLKKNSWGIPEPVDGIEIPPSQIEVVFLPLLAFDLQGHRVGYGKGFYDRFLQKCSRKVIKIGLSVFEPVERITDTGDHDITMNYGVTPERVYEF